MVGRYRLTLVDECALEDRSVEPSAAIDRRVEPVSRGQNRASSRRRDGRSWPRSHPTRSCPALGRGSADGER
jgi:hypothetical protein